MAKNFLSVAAIFKNESHILAEWIEHYLKEGVDHFYLIDNGSTDDWKSALMPYAGVITLGHDDRPHFQNALYNGYVLPLKHEMDWLLVCDLDEFAYTKTGTIKEFIQRLSPMVNGVRMSWVQFGSSGHVKQPKSVIDGFRLRRRYETVVRVETKQIVRMKEVDHLGVHEHAICGWVIVDGCLHPADNICAADTDENYIKNAELLMNHYQVQSKDWFTKVKMTRGDAVHQVNVRDEAYFLQYDFNDVVDDTLAVKRGFSARQIG